MRLLLVALALAACSSVDRLPMAAPCTAGQTIACACAGGAAGTQTCDPSGIYLACQCPDGGGADVVPVVDSAAPDAPLPRDGGGDAVVVDSGPVDTGALDSGTTDTGVADTGAGTDAGDGGPPADAPGETGADACVNCGSGCVDTMTDPANCGGCGSTCTVVNGVAACVGGVCHRDHCTAPYAHCVGSDPMMCETNTATDVMNCGMCGMWCSFRNASAQCVAPDGSIPSCIIGACNHGWCNRDGNDANGCESPC